MPLSKDTSGRRFVEAAAEVPGTPEEVWQAIASGPGISSWFVPTRMEGRVGGQIVASFGPDMDAVATITVWEPPRRLIAESHDGGPNDRIVATEWTVEGQAGGSCVVRVVHSWLADSDQWDTQFEGHAHGWAAFFRILRLYLLHFAGQPSASFQLMAMTPQSISDAWHALVAPLRLDRAEEGQQVMAQDGEVRLAARVEHVGPPEHPELLLQVDTPARGLGHLFAMAMGGQTCVSARFFTYGEDAPALSAAMERAWTPWLDARVRPDVRV